MTRLLRMAALVLAISALLAVGYLLGQHHDHVVALITTPGANGGSLPQPAHAATERPVLYYKHPMGKPDYSPVPKKDEMGMEYLPVYGDEEASSATAGTASGASTQAGRKLLYYRDPMGKADYSPEPKKDAMGMDYLPVYEEDAGASSPGGTDSRQAAGSGAQPEAKAKGKILYYRNPMGLPDSSPTPKKDSMGMDYIPVYEGDDDDGNTVKISPAKIQRLGVRTEAARLRELTRSIRAVGTVHADERRLFTITPKFEGYIEKLHVNTTGQAVKRGEPLMEVYSPELVAAQQEYLLAWRSQKDVEGAGPEIRASAQQLANASMQRLRYWDISDDQLQRLRREGRFTRTLTFRAPAGGVVLEKNAVEGMRFMPGEPLYKIADLSTVWVIAEVFEQELGLVRLGQNARVTVSGFPGEAFTGKVAFVYPTLARETRTGRVRIEIPNPDGQLKTDMYAHVAIAAPLTPEAAVVVPDSAVLNSGNRQVVLVDRGEGRFEPREVKLGPRAEGYQTILEGLKPDERVVVAANFLIDAESNLRAALRAFTPPVEGDDAKPAAPTPEAGGAQKQ